MLLIFTSGKFIFRCDFAEKEIAKSAGCRWNPESRHWWTDRPEVARKLEQYADISAREQLGKAAARIEESKLADANIDIPKPEGCEYLGYQKAGIAFALDRFGFNAISQSGQNPSKLFHGGVLIADEMGLGKTIQALGVINADETIKNVLVICPASLRLNWKREAEKWLVRKTTINVMTADWVKSVEGFNIINYDILKRLDKTKEWDLLIADECHALKNMKAQRTKEVMGYHPKDSSKKPVEGIKAKRKILMTGTPIVNRPVELYSLIHYLDPARWSNFFWFAKRFCGGTEGRYGWDMSGATNLDELQDSLRSSIMVRRLKKDVLKELPPKRRQIIEIPANGCGKLIEKEKAAFEQIRERVEEMQAQAEISRAGSDEEYRAAVEKLKSSQMLDFTEITKLRHETALAKVPYVVAHVLELLEDEENLVVMAHHRDVISGIRAGLKVAKIESVQLTGEDSMEERQKSVDDFQAGKVPVFVGSIHAAGVGITLTKASTVVFSELDWVPGIVSQAEDRLHRIGQEESVLVQHLVLEGSIDAVMAKTIVEKQSVIDQALDVMVRSEPVLPLKENRQTGSRIDLQKIGETLTADDIFRIHSDLKTLANLDKDHANIVNGIGFNKIDGRIGHDLAALPYLSKLQAALGRKIIFKYSKQLGR